METILSDLHVPIIRSATQLKELSDFLEGKNAFVSVTLGRLTLDLDHQRVEVFKWLSAIPHKTHHRAIGKGFLLDSGQWLLQKTEFVDWRASSISSALWLHGIRKVPNSPA